MTPDTPSSAIYTRVSTDEQAREGVSLAAQEARCRDYCALVGLEVHRVYSDAAVSGSVPLAARPAASALHRSLRPPCPPDSSLITHHSSLPSPSPPSLAARRSQLPSAVVSIKLDRLFRNTLDALTHIEAWDAAGISLHLLDFGGQALDTRSAIGKLFLTVLSAFAQFERDLTAERVTAALAHIASTGRMPQGIVFGYDRDGQGALVPSPGEAPIVVTLFSRFAAGETLTALCNELNADGPGPPHGGTAWRRTTVHELLSNPVFLGEFRHRGDVLRGTHEPLIELDLWERVQARLHLHAGNSGRAQRTHASLFRCGVCGGRMTWDRMVQRRKTMPPRVYERLLCNSRRQAMVTHKHFSLPALPALELIWQATADLLSQGDWQSALAVCRPDNPVGPAVAVRGSALQGATPSPSAFPPDSSFIIHHSSLPSHSAFPPDSSLITHHSSLPSPSPSSRLQELSSARLANMDAFHRGLLTMADLEAVNAPLMAEERSLRLTGARSSRRAPTLDFGALVGQSAQDLMLALRASDLETQLSVLLSLWEPAIASPDRTLTLISRLPSIPPLTLPVP